MPDVVVAEPQYEVPSLAVTKGTTNGGFVCVSMSQYLRNQRERVFVEEANALLRE